MDEATRRYIEERIASYRADNADSHWEREAEGSAEHNALPIYREWTATIGLRPDGSLIEWSTEDDPPYVKAVDDARMRRVYLVEGAKRHPPLADLVPARSPHGVDCPGCEGSGQVFLEGKPIDVVCYCGGLGWLEPDERDAIRRAESSLTTPTKSRRRTTLVWGAILFFSAVAIAVALYCSTTA